MFIKRSFFSILSLLFMNEVNAKEWNEITTPAAGNVQIYGKYANGCIAGSSTLPQTDLGYQQVNRDRNRYYGHPNLIAVIKNLGNYAFKHNKQLLIGDLSQPRGGKMNFGHASHQIGLDADIWLATQDIVQNQSPKIISTKFSAESVVKPLDIEFNQNWSSFYRDLLYQVSSNTKVKRIFVNPVIKAKLCATEKNKTWLRKLRPWWGHDSHFHIRLQCPTDQEYCVDQQDIPEGSGCGEEVQIWINKQIDSILNPNPKKASIPKPISTECKIIQDAP